MPNDPLTWIKAAWTIVYAGLALMFAAVGLIFLRLAWRLWRYDPNGIERAKPDYPSDEDVEAIRKGWRTRKGP